jgi:hypothetical protein
MSKISTYAKAIAGVAVPGLVTLGSAITAGSDGGTNITGSEWLTALIACVVTGGTVWAVPNRPYVHTENAARDLP